MGVAHKFITLSGNGSCVDGPVLLDAHCYNFTSWGGGTVRNAKALSVFLTSDGFAMLNRDCTVEHCFVYVGDNALVFSGRNIVFNDVTVGTSCGALYPQNDVNSATLENIYVFRADEGVINNYWSDGSKSDRMVNVTINGLYADDCATLPYFFKGRNMGRAEKVFNMSDVTCRSTRGVVDYYTAPTNGFILFDTVEGELFTDNYTFNIKNLYIDGKLVSSADDLNIMQSGTDAANHINVTSDSTAVVTRKDYFIDYRSILNIFIGALQVYTDSPAIDDGVEIYLPVREIKALLRVSGTVDTTEKNGIAYVEVNDLVTAGLVEKVQKNGNALILTPVPKNGNLLLADSGDIPYFTEHRPYCVDMTARIEGGETIYTLANIIESDSGIRRALTSDVKMYGNGKYVLKFRIFGDGAARVKVSCQTAESSDVVVDKILSLDGTWTEVEIGFDISMDLSSIKNYSFSVASKDTSLEFFEIKNIALEKIG